MAGGLTITTTLTGAEGAVRKFVRLDRAIAGTIVKRSTRAGLRPQLRAAKATTRFQDITGKLRRAMRQSVRSRKRGLITTGRVLIKGDARHGMPVEYGHRIAVGRSGRSEKDVVLRRKDGRPKKLHQTYGTNAGRVAGRHYLRNAFERTHRAAQQEFTNDFVSGVNAEAVRG